ncbi:MAG: phosphatidate cytidylyltransferase, partial [Actinomycetota bacterium]|nr:phosphatidate cytidylyltransferase [Actinomycetota bacterium]
MRSALVSRVLVAALALPPVLLALWFGGWWLFTLVLLAALVALHEFAVLTRPLRPLVLAAYLGSVAMLLGAMLGGLTWLLGGFLATFLLAFVLQGLTGTRRPATAAMGTTLLGAGWVGLGLGHVLLLRELPPEGFLTLLTVVLTVFAADIFAFFAGRMVGRHKLAPTISPGKTWEGFVAGTIAALAVAFFALYEERDTYLTIAQSLLLGGTIAVAGALGDLFQSTLKRDMQVKDTGRLLGGHGGMLDRVDALLFSAVAGYHVIAALD